MLGNGAWLIGRGSGAKCGGEVVSLSFLVPLAAAQRVGEPPRLRICSMRELSGELFPGRGAQFCPRLRKM